MISAQVKIQFQIFFLKNQIFGSPSCSTLENLSKDVPITNVGLISEKPGRFLFSGYRPNSISLISNFFEKKNQIFVFSCCSTREELSIDASITTVGLILTKAG